MSQQKEIEIAKANANYAIRILETDVDEAWAMAHLIGRNGYEMPEELLSYESLVDGFTIGQQEYLKYRDRDIEDSLDEVAEEYDSDLSM